MAGTVGRPMLRLVGAGVDETPRVLHAVNAQERRGWGETRAGEGQSGDVRGGESRVGGARESESHENGERAGRIGAENSNAARLTDTDARWILARRTAAMLEGGNGGPAARLRPERRRDLHDLATRLGLRAFDANLVMAVVQDAAVNEGAALSEGCRERLTMVGAARNAVGDAEGGSVGTVGITGTERMRGNVRVRRVGASIDVKTMEARDSADELARLARKEAALRRLTTRVNAPGKLALTKPVEREEEAAATTGMDVALQFGVSLTLAAIGVVMMAGWVVR